jgi:hypothetical protein
MSTINKLGVTEDGRIRYIEVNSLVMDAAGGIIGDIVFTGKFDGRNLSSVKHKSFLTDSAMRKLRSEGMFQVLKEEAEDAIMHYYKQYNQNVPAQVNLSRYAVDIDILPMPKERKINIKRKKMEKKSRK